MAINAGGVFINIFAKTQQLVRDMNKANKAIKGFDRSVKGMIPNVMNLQAILAGFATGAGIKSLWDTQVVVDQLNRSFKAITGSSYGAGQELEYVRSVADRLGQEYYSLTESMKYVAAAAKDTTLEGKGVRDIFLAVTEASTALGLTNVQTKMSLYAISQMISKGTVNAEELRQQLGERLPGAYQAMARALGVTTAKLSEMLEQGAVVATEAIPKFAKELHRMYADAAMLARNAPIGMLNRFKTAWIDLKNEMGQGQFLTTASGTLGRFTELLKDYDFQQSLHGLVEQLSRIADIGIQNAVPAIKGMTEALGDLSDLLGDKVIMELAKLAAAFYMFGSKGAIAYGAYKGFDFLQNFNEYMAPKNRLEELKEEEKLYEKFHKQYEKGFASPFGDEERRLELYNENKKKLEETRAEIERIEKYNRGAATPAYDPRGRHDPNVWAADAAKAAAAAKKLAEEDKKAVELTKAQEKALKEKQKFDEKIRKEILAQEQEVYDMEQKQKREIEDIFRDKMAEMRKKESEEDPFHGKAWGGPLTEDSVAEAKAKLDAINNETKDTFNWMVKASEETARSMQSSFSDFFYDAFTNKMKNLSDILQSFLDSLLKSFSSIMGQMATQSLFGSSFLAGEGPMGGLFGGMFSFDSGGYLGERVVGVGASSGKSYEFHNDEFVFNRKQLRNAGGSGMQVIVNEAANTPEEGITTETSNQGGIETMVINLVNKQVSNPSSQIGRSLTHTYGLGRTLRNS